MAGENLVTVEDGMNEVRCVAESNEEFFFGVIELFEWHLSSPGSRTDNGRNSIAPDIPAFLGAQEHEALLTQWQSQESERY